MNNRQKLKSLYAVLGYRLFSNRTPLSVSWSLTNNCNLKCSYCQVYQNNTKELPTKEVLRIIDELALAGTVRIGFTGGEPFLRPDIFQIINQCKNNGIFTGVVTNGTMIDKNLETVKLIDLIQLSIDGPIEINDQQRCKGAYKATIKAIHTLKNLKKRFWITSVLSKLSFDQTGYLIDLAKQHKTKVYFQPCLDYELCGLNAKELVPEINKFKDTVNHLIDLKKRGYHSIGNSLMGLKALLHYPNKNRTLEMAKCYAGNLYCHIYSDGKLFSCFNMEDEKGMDLKKNSFKNAFSKIKTPDCKGCFSYATIEMNLALGLKPNSVINSLRILK